ncbi:MAG: 23S rRNA (guanosine(2251)-2'-O)-methyltransferase RlmB [Candidatus Nanopelagicales bacterium]|nr:23S rRNA (guanosine(2251)-2'-O)-methyltransferase RlmB [Candidatus Nanopelagicales bacterium]MDD2819076.1 23S rRNA (guanosine(2251)-2'-O)-methyltransferase RlmB [Candidatus Nanopelagicales bacterium]
MAGNSQRRGAMRNPGTKKGATVGSGGQRRKQLKGKGPTPKAVERPYHQAAKRKKASERAADSPRSTSTGGRRPARREDSSMLMGRNAVVEGLRAGVPGKTLYMQTRVEADDRWRESLRRAIASNIPVLEVTKIELDRMTDGSVHQGMVLTVPAYEYSELSDISDSNLIVALDGVTDARNLGAIARSAAAFGAGGIVVPARRSAGVNAGAWKTSAGALARVPVAQVTNLTRALKSLQTSGYAVVGLAAEAEHTFADLPKRVLSEPVVIVIGSEGKGLSRLVAETCDWQVRIEMFDGNESLNASVAAGIALHAVSIAR